MAGRWGAVATDAQAPAAGADGGGMTVSSGGEQQFLGHHCRVLVECGGQQLEAASVSLLEGERARVTVAPHALVLFDPAPERVISS